MLCIFSVKILSIQLSWVRLVTFFENTGLSQQFENRVSAYSDVIHHKMVVRFNGGRVVLILPEGALPLLSLVEFQSGPARD